MYLIFDTETTGLPRDYKAPLTDFDNWPRLVQIAWQLHDAKGKLLNAQNHIVKPNGFEIPYNSEKIHGISTKRALEEGKELNEVLALFAADIERSELLIGHNVEFDLSIMGCEYLRTGINSKLLNTKSFCTKEETTEYCAIPGGRGGKFKWPTLTELHQKLFGTPVADAHDAAYDVSATAKCFFGLIPAGVLPPAAGLSAGDVVYEAPQLADSNFAKKEEKKGIDLNVGGKVSAGNLRPFCHLHTHSKFSILQSTADAKLLVKKAKAYGMPAVAITDMGNMFHAINAVDAGKKEEIKVIVGCELYVTEDRLDKNFNKEKRDKPFLLPILAKNQTGYANLSKLSSIGYVEGFYYTPRIDKSILEQHTEGLIVLSGGMRGELADLILNTGEAQAEEALLWYIKHFGDDFYLEVMRHGLEEENRVNEVLLRLAQKHNVKLLATNNVFYLEKTDAKAHDALLCVDAGEKVSTPIGTGRGYRFGFPNDEFYFKTTEEMNRLFADLPQALNSSIEIAEKCEQVKIKRDILLPEYKMPEGFTDQNDYLKYLAYEGAKKKFGETLAEEITDRLDFELGVIKQMGFPGYFLIVQDFCNASREMGVWVGPGRGSAAGSLVAFVVGITNIDPIKYNLLFERFLNPERVSMPDIDIDFDDEGRGRVIEYVINKYGKNQVAQIVTYGSMQPKMAIRDVARVLDLPLSEADKIAKMVPDTPGTSFEKALKESQELAAVAKSNEPAGEVVRLAQVLEGSVRNTGIHAAGVIIAPKDLLECVPVCTAKDADLWVTQFEGKVVESAGMLKMDFLGLKTLTIIKDAIRMIKKNHGVDIDPDLIPLEDVKTYELYQRGDTIGTFQFESDGMRKYLQDLKPTNIEDLIAMNALYRPGPLQFIPNFINRKHGKEKVEYPHPLLEELLKPTYGIMVYQEQIMQTAQILAGYSLGGADLLRRAMGKKDMKVMEQQKQVFVEGAKTHHNVPEKQSLEVFEIMMKFAEYGFNRSHAAAYSVLAYQTGYLKAHYPAEYMASVLTHNMSSIDKVSYFMEECRRQNVDVLGPDVNESSAVFDVNKEGKIRFGLAGIKGTGDAAVKSVIEEREAKGPFKDVFDFSQRINLRAVNKKSFESFALSGTFDCFNGMHRAMFFHTDENSRSSFIETLIKYGNAMAEEKASAQFSLFGGGSDSSAAMPTPSLPKCEAFSQLESLKREKELIGIYISGHPLDPFRLELENFCNIEAARLSEDLSTQINKDLIFAGIVENVFRGTTKSGKPWGKFTIEDFNGSTEVALFGEDFLKFSAMLQPGQFLMVRGRVEVPRWKPDGKPELKVNKLTLLHDVREQMCKGFMLNIEAQKVSSELIAGLNKVLTDFPGKCEVKICFTDTDEDSRVEMRANKIRVSPANEFLNELNKLKHISVNMLKG